ncbi:MAG: protein kinase [Polyangiales bacterium]|nr:protein kinase [Myxococcales bacterium]MCB9659143.1 protein kinase [Sandaracinaceae bacterium]
MSEIPHEDEPVTLFGAYKLVDRVAVGGMAEIFRAIEPRPVGEDRVICVKRMLPHLASEPGALAMFEEEARLGAHIRHPNVVQMLGFGESEGQPYLALEYVRGCDLWRLLRWVQHQGLGLPLETCSYVIQEILRGLTAIHTAHDAEGVHLGVVHRDVSPSNVLLSVHGEVKLGDLGIAQSHLSAHLPARHSGRRMGKLGYLAPEQVAGAPLDVRTDLFAVGVIAAELLMGGKPLFRGGSELAILLAIRDANTDHFDATAKSLPSPVAAFVRSLLAASPDARPGSAADAQGALAAALHEAGVSEPDAPMRKQFGDLIAHATGEYLKVTGEYPLPLDVPDIEKTPHIELSLEQLARGEAPLFPSRNPLAERDTLVPGAPAVQPDDPSVGLSNPLLTGPDGAAPVRAPRQYAICAGGEWREQLTYAQVVESVALGQLHPLDQLRLPSGDTFRLEEVPEFMRHARGGTLGSITQDSLPTLQPSTTLPADEGGIVVALGRSLLREETGLWLAEQGAVRKEIYIVDGAPVMVASNMAGELLGEYLVARGVVSRGELDMALAVMPRFEGKLGDTLVALGLVEPVHLFQHIASQVEEKLLETALWKSGVFSFYPGATAPGERFPLASGPWEILLEATRRRLMHGLDPVDVGDPHGAAVWKLGSALPRTLATSTLPGLVALALTVLRKPHSTADLLAALDDPEGRDRLRGARVLTVLAQLRVAVPSEPTRAASEPT